MIYMQCSKVTIAVSDINLTDIIIQGQNELGELLVCVWL